jgi:hypothetical protein
MVEDRLSHEKHYGRTTRNPATLRRPQTHKCPTSPRTVKRLQGRQTSEPPLPNKPQNRVLFSSKKSRKIYRFTANLGYKVRKLKKMILPKIYNLGIKKFKLMETITYFQPKIEFEQSLSSWCTPRA